MQRSHDSHVDNNDDNANARKYLWYAMVACIFRFYSHPERSVSVSVEYGAVQAVVGGVFVCVRVCFDQRSGF